MIIETNSWNMTGTVVLQQTYYALICTIGKSYVGTIRFIEMNNGYSIVCEGGMTLEDLTDKYRHFKIGATFNLALENILPEDNMLFIFHLSKESESKYTSYNCIIDVITEGAMIK